MSSKRVGMKALTYHGIVKALIAVLLSKLSLTRYYDETNRGMLDQEKLDICLACAPAQDCTHAPRRQTGWG
eukprot:226638-Amorphochlora_amoeboformis.AAC.1